MQIEDMLLISVDDHRMEHPDQFEGRIAGKYDDEVNKISYENACRWYSFAPFERTAGATLGSVSAKLDV
jgi:hypothetical protein